MSLCMCDVVATITITLTALSVREGTINVSFPPASVSYIDPLYSTPF